MLNSLSISALAALVNGAIADFQLPIKEVGKFKDKATALVKVQRMMDQYDFILEGDKLVKRPEQPGDAEIRQEMKKELVEEIGQERYDAVSQYREVPVADKTPKTEKAPKADKPKRGRTSTVNREPKPANEIQACRAGSNQALLIDVLLGGATLNAATRFVNNESGKNLKDSVIYSTILYDLCTVKGYGVRVEAQNGEQLYKNDHFVDANELHFNDKGAGEGYDPEATRLVYFLVLPEGMDRPLEHTARKTPTAEEKAAKPKKAKKGETKTEAGADPVDPAETPAEVEADAEAAAAE